MGIGCGLSHRGLDGSAPSGFFLRCDRLAGRGMTIEKGTNCKAAPCTDERQQDYDNTEDQGSAVFRRFNSFLKWGDLVPDLLAPSRLLNLADTSCSAIGNPSFSDLLV